MSTVLVVDDMPIFRDPIAASLRLAGYETLCAADGAAALASARVRRPDVVLLDLSMPVMDGFAFLDELRNHPRLANVPVILLTAASDRKFIIEAARYGVKDYLLKSRFSLVELLARVRKYAEPDPTATRRTG